MAARERYPRTRQQVKNLKESQEKGKKSNGEVNGDLKGTRVTWCLDQKSTEFMYAEELDVEELKWPDEESRDSSQDQIKISKNNEPNSKQVQSRQFVNCSSCTSSTVVIDATNKPNNCRLPRNEKQQIRAKAAAVVDIDQTGPFSSLSDEIILGIFKFLQRKNITICARVCKHWQRLAYDESLWRNVNLGSVTIRAGLIGRILTRGVWVLRLAHAKVESPCFDDSLVEFQDVVPLSPNSPSETLLSVRYMDATLCHFEGDSLLCLLMHSRRLKYLSLESCEVSSSVLSSNTSQQPYSVHLLHRRAISECQFLEVLNLAMCPGVTSSGVSALVSGCKRLTHLNLAWTNLGTVAIEQIVQNLPELRQLNLSGCRDTLTDDVVEKLVKTCLDITHLDLSDCNYLTARTLELLAQPKYLQHLSLSRCYSISPLSFSLCARMSALVKLSVFGLLNAEGLEALKKELSGIAVNSCIFSKVARPVDTKYYRGTIWGVKCSV